MSCRITIPTWPTCLDCLSWSKDNFIAVAGGDQIAILTPRLGELGPNGTHWDTTVFKINEFTDEEVPLSDPLSFEASSPGEELSLRHVQALEWSSPGLSRNGRCVLAILSSNHVLSLWVCHGKPDRSANWKREVVMNHTVQRYYSQTGGNQGGEQSERMQVAQRIHAFSWSLPLYEESDYEQARFTPCVPDGSHFLSVSTEKGDILVLRLSPSRVTQGPKSRQLSIEVVHCFNLNAMTLHALTAPRLNEEGQSESHHNDRLVSQHIAWGPWKYTHDTNPCAPFAVITKGKLFSFHIDADTHNSSKDVKFSRNSESRHFISARSDITGPLRFVPRTGLLIAFAPDQVYCNNTYTDPSEASSLKFHHLDGRWDETSGVAFSEYGESLPSINITSHLSTSTTATTALALPLDDEDKSLRPCWQAAINESKASFSDQYSLDGYVQERTWGIAASSLGDYVATAITMVPSNSVAYTTPADYRTVINISLEMTEEECLVFPSSGGISQMSEISAEILLFNMQRYLDRHPDILDANTLVQAMPKASNRISEHRTSGARVSPISERSSTKDLVQHLQRRIYMAQPMIDMRVKLLANIALGQAQTGRHVSKEVVQCLITEVTELWSHFQQGGHLSHKIRNIYALLSIKLDLQVQPLGNGASHASSDEQCRICNEAISFESLKWARCPSGHQFSRCALTFLAIQEPDISTTCGVCGTQFLDAWKLAEFSSGGSDAGDVGMPDYSHIGLQVPSGNRDGTTVQRLDLTDSLDPEAVFSNSNNDGHLIEPPASLARILFAAFECCIYCGGRFVA